MEKYAVLYSVTARTIRVITIYHTAINPETIRSFDELRYFLLGNPVSSVVKLID
jgi:hypothetical protein